MNGESEVFRLGRNITLYPVVHGSGDSAVEVRRLMLSRRFDCLAVPLPPSFQAEVEQAVECLPRISVVLQRQPLTDFSQTDSDDPRQTASYVPIDPCQPVISAIRIARQERIPRVFIDIESDEYLSNGVVLPDPWALKRVSAERFAAAVLPTLQRPESAEQWQHLRWMAGRLQRRYCVCAVCRTGHGCERPFRRDCSRLSSRSGPSQRPRHFQSTVDR
jgi:hypothetical protein